MPVFLCYDFGGTKLAAGLADTEQGHIYNSFNLPTPQDARSSLDLLVSAGQRLISEHTNLKLSGIGVSFGGTVCPDQRTVHSSHHVPGWEAYPLADELEHRFNLPTWIFNDANSAAFGEFHCGAGKGVNHLLYLTVSTGIGGGLVLDGKIFCGEHALAGEIGHMILQPEGPACPCGRRGCLEALASGRSIARKMEELLQGHAQVSGFDQDITAKQVAEAAAAGDLLAYQVWSEAMHWLGIGVANAVNMLDPGIVVIGGGLSRAGEWLFEPVKKVISRYSLYPEVEVVPAQLSDDANLLGAALLASSTF